MPPTSKHPKKTPIMTIGLPTGKKDKGKKKVISPSVVVSSGDEALDWGCYNFSYFALFTYVFSLFLEVSHGTAALTYFSLTHIAATLLTHSTAIVLTHSIAILIAYSGQSCLYYRGHDLGI